MRPPPAHAPPTRAVSPSTPSCRPSTHPSSTLVPPTSGPSTHAASTLAPTPSAPPAPSTLVDTRLERATPPLLASFTGAFLELGRICVLVVAVPSRIFDDPGEAELYRFGFALRYQRHIILAARAPRERGGVRYQGPSDLVRILELLPRDAIPWSMFPYASTASAPPTPHVDKVRSFLRIVDPS